MKTKYNFIITIIGVFILTYLKTLNVETLNKPYMLVLIIILSVIVLFNLCVAVIKDLKV